MSIPITPQLPLALPFPPDRRFAAFVGAAAEVALLRATAAGERTDWIYLHGPPGSGKSHLLIAACAHAAESGRQPRYLSLGDAAERPAEALAGLEAADLVCLDDLDAAAGRRDAEVALFDFHNRARGSGASVMYAARSSPAQLPLTLPDLRSRLGQCVQLALPPLNDAGRREALHRRAQARGLSLDPAVLDYLLTRVGRDLTSLTALLDRLDRESLAAKRRITVPFLRELLRGPLSDGST